jgi:alpha-mannosidase
VAKAIRVTGPDGKDVPAQLSNGKALFLARAPAVGFAVYDVQLAEAAGASTFNGLNATESSLENDRYSVKIDEHGDVASVFDKQLNRELLSAPIRLAISTDNPRQWPAWNMDFEDEKRAPRAFVGGPAKVRVVESGPVRVAVEVERETEGSRFVQRISLSEGDGGNRLEFSNAIDWNTRQANLKATFPLAPANRMATYNWDIGTIQRPNEEERQFEVASHQWIDLTDNSGSFGVTILTDCKNASDKADDQTLRLTLVRTPGTRGGFADQGTQDLGRHEIIFGLAGHSGDWRQSRSDWQAYRLNQPLIAFQSSSHAGQLGKSFSLAKLNNDRVRLMALKKAELSDELVVRLVEMDGKAAENVRLSFPAPIVAAREVNGQEQPVGPASLTSGDLVTSLGAYQPRTFALKLGPPRTKLAMASSQAVTLDYDLSVASRLGRPPTAVSTGSQQSGSVPGKRYLPVLPRQIDLWGTRFSLAPANQCRRQQWTDHPAATGKIQPAVPAGGSHERRPERYLSHWR